jgi:hypothetical protein
LKAREGDSRLDGNFQVTCEDDASNPNGHGEAVAGRP